VDVRIDDAGQDPGTARIDDVLRVRQCPIRAKPDDDAVRDGDTTVDDLITRDDAAISDDTIHGHWSFSRARRYSAAWSAVRNRLFCSGVPTLTRI